MSVDVPVCPRCGMTVAPTGVEVTALVMARPRTLNAERRGSVWSHRRATEAEVEAWGWAWRSVTVGVSKRLHRVEVIARPFLAPPMQDPGNAYPTVKAAVDAAVAVGLLPDDSAAHVARVILEAPQQTTRSEQRLVVTLREVL